MTAAGVPQLAQRLGLDLADALARYREMLADLFQRMLAAVLQPEAHFDDLLLAGAERLQHLRGLLPQVEIDHRLRWRNHAPVDDEVAEVRLFFLAHRGFQ